MVAQQSAHIRVDAYESRQLDLSELLSIGEAALGGFLSQQEIGCKTTAFLSLARAFPTLSAIHDKFPFERAS